MKILCRLRYPLMKRLNYRIYNGIMNRYWIICLLIVTSLVPFIFVILTFLLHYARIIPFQFRTRPRTWYSFGIQQIPSWLIRRSSCRNSIYRTTTRPIVRSNTRPETSRAYRLSSICAGDWAITCFTRTSRPPWSSSCPGSPFGSNRKPSQLESPLAWRHCWPSVGPVHIYISIARDNYSWYLRSR